MNTYLTALIYEGWTFLFAEEMGLVIAKASHPLFYQASIRLAKKSENHEASPAFLTEAINRLAVEVYNQKWSHRKAGSGSTDKDVRWEVQS